MGDGVNGEAPGCRVSVGKFGSERGLKLTSAFDTHYWNEAELRDAGIGSVGFNVRVSERATVVGLANIHLGSNIRVDSYVSLLCGRGPLQVGDNVHIEPSSSLVSHHGVEIGNYCTISHGVRLFTASADYSGESFTNAFPLQTLQSPKTGKIVLHDHVILGANSVVMPDVSIGLGAAIGALSFVRQSVPAWGIYAGNPLRYVGPRSQKILQLAQNLGQDPRS